MFAATTKTPAKQQSKATVATATATATATAPTTATATVAIESSLKKQAQSAGTLLPQLQQSSFATTATTTNKALLIENNKDKSNNNNNNKMAFGKSIKMYLTIFLTTTCIYMVLYQYHITRQPMTATELIKSKEIAGTANAHRAAAAADGDFKKSRTTAGANAQSSAKPSSSSSSSASASPSASAFSFTATTTRNAAALSSSSSSASTLHSRATITNKTNTKFISSPTTTPTTTTTATKTTTGAGGVAVTGTTTITTQKLMAPHRAQSSSVADGSRYIYNRDNNNGNNNNDNYNNMMISLIQLKAEEEDVAIVAEEEKRHNKHIEQTNNTTATTTTVTNTTITTNTRSTNTVTQLNANKTQTTHASSASSSPPSTSPIHRTSSPSAYNTQAIDATTSNTPSIDTLEGEVPKPPPPLYIITPTYRRPEQLAELTRLGYTLKHVVNLLWLVIEDANVTSPLVTQTLNRIGVPYQYLIAPMPEIYKKTKKAKPRGVSNRNRGLEWLRANAKEGVFYFADDDNTYDISIFEQMRYTKKVSMWPVGLVTKYGVSSPIIRHGNIVGFYDGWIGGRKYPVDMAGFAVSVKFLLERPTAKMPYKPGYEEDGFLKSLAPLNNTEIELLASNCTEILTWHTQTKKNAPAEALNMGKYGDTNLVRIDKVLVRP